MGVQSLHADSPPLPGPPLPGLHPSFPPPPEWAAGEVRDTYFPAEWLQGSVRSFSRHPPCLCLLMR